jgi:hypothetical protein
MFLTRSNNNNLEFYKMIIRLFICIKHSEQSRYSKYRHTNRYFNTNNIIIILDILTAYCYLKYSDVEFNNI